MKPFFTMHRKEQGQSLVEFALILPLMLLLILGTVEVGYAMLHYMQIASANREAVRLAARGRFSDDIVAARVISSGGSRELSPGVWEPNLRTMGADPNTGIIITRIDIPVETGDPVQTTFYVSGTVTLADSQVDLSSGLMDYRRGVDEDINDYRDINDYEVNEIETYVTVETFYEHHLLTSGVPFLPDPFTLYFSSTMRILLDSRLN